MAKITSKLIISIFIVTCLTSCTVTKILNFTLLKYDVALIEVSGVKNSMEYGELAYVDSLIGINFSINKSKRNILCTEKYVYNYPKNSME